MRTSTTSLIGSWRSQWATPIPRPTSKVSCSRSPPRMLNKSKDSRIIRTFGKASHRRTHLKSNQLDWISSRQTSRWRQLNLETILEISLTEFRAAEQEQALRMHPWTSIRTLQLITRRNKYWRIWSKLRLIMRTTSSCKTSVVRWVVSSLAHWAIWIWRPMAWTQPRTKRLTNPWKTWFLPSRRVSKPRVGTAHPWAEETRTFIMIITIRALKSSISRKIWAWPRPYKNHKAEEETQRINKEVTPIDQAKRNLAARRKQWVHLHKDNQIKMKLPNCWWAARRSEAKSLLPVGNRSKAISNQIKDLTLVEDRGPPSLTGMEVPRYLAHPLSTAPKFSTCLLTSKTTAKR